MPLLLCLIGRLPYSSPPRLQARRWTAASGRWSPWFGAKGVASVYFLALLIEGGTITGGEADTVIWTAVAVAIVSILVHGATADPLSRRLLDEDRQA